MQNAPQTKDTSKKIFWSALLGNVMDHYDTALYGFLAPFIAPVFFPKEDPIVALILTYGLMSAALITRPLGALYFGKRSGQRGSKNSLLITLLGLSCTTGLMGVIPDYTSIGALAPLGLVLLRMGQGFFAAGETTIAPFLILELSEKKKHGRTNGYYGSTQILGILIASGVATIISFAPNPEELWRWPFIASLFTGVFGVYLRSNTKNIVKNKIPIQKINIVHTLICHKAVLWRLIILSSVTYITYSIPFVFMNSFVPKVTTITLSQMMFFNTALLVLDMLLAPVLGAFSDRFSRKNFMIAMSSGLMLLSIPFFLLIPNATLFTITLIRIGIVLLGLGINVPFRPWFMNQITGPERYLLMGVGYSIGSELFGRNAPAICLWLWHSTDWVIAPAIYMSVISFSAILALTLNNKEQFSLHIINIFMKNLYYKKIKNNSFIN